MSTKNMFAQSSLAAASSEGNGGVGFGCMGVTAFYGDAMSDEAAIELFKCVYDNGCRHFDTAEIYKTGDPLKDAPEDEWNEKQLGLFLRTVPRESFTVATKFMPYKYEAKCDYETVKGALLNSLERLGLEYADLYYCHRIPSLEAALEFTASCKKLQEEGLIKHIGLSEIIGAWLRKCYEVAKIAAVQQEWSLLTRNHEAELIPVCKELDVAVVAYSPLGRNLLTGVVTEPPTDWRGKLPRYSPENIQKNVDLIKEVEGIAASHDCTAAQLSLAWLFHKAKQYGVNVIPIPGTTKQKHAISNIEAAKVKIADNEMAPLEAIAERVAGERGDEDYTGYGIEAQLAQGKL
ncbi:hypothetical protein CTAYLR_007977 [Chrysophaeum taylorii]|uniref:NADP-dependent oxidoreductase domain-containing protein n=1 Tax=Chrysophaeum taylorii TaxID=2483200 RepID=A0AAD7U7T1_9STRA|nr:hypothetical protein CTAYLR_007977 [Chrysophaeum taylorii]